MQITLSSRTWELLEERIKEGDYPSADDAIRTALEALQGEAIDDADPDTQAAIERAEAEADGGDGIALDDAFARLRAKHFGT